MLHRIWHSASTGLNRFPRAYRPGSLLQHLQSDLADFGFERLTADCARVRETDLQIDIQEIVEAQFLMHVVSSEFTCEFAASSPQRSTTITARHCGAWRRTGVVFRSNSGEHHALAARLTQSAPLQGALLALDFTQWRLQSIAAGWRLSLRHFGGSEVVGHLPAFRRYVRLEKAQCEALVASMRAVGAVLDVTI